jgi:chitinase domain-containing protein 1
MQIRYFLFVLVLFLLLLPVSSKYKRRSHYDSSNTKEDDESTKNNLLGTRVTSAQIIKNHNLYDSSRKNTKGFTQGKVLGYVTPWNNHGYDVVKVFTDKFDYISPVWLQIKAIKSEESIDFFVTGKHDIDQGWIREVKSLARENVPKFVPRVIFEGFTDEDWINILENESLRERLARVLCDLINENQFDGLVLEYYGEAHFRIQRAVKDQVLRFSLADFSKELADKIHRDTSKQVLLVISPWSNMFNANDLQILSRSIDYFSVMTYDYSSGGYGKIGANSPLPWIENIIHTYENVANFDLSKILIGLNFYGMMSEANSRPEAIIGPSFIQMLKDGSFKANWDESAKEHAFVSDKSSTTIFYPTLKSISDRIELARKHGVGLAIWETGQGLDYFYDLF